MQILLSIIGTLSLLFGMFALHAGKSDIQVGIAATAILGAFILFGICSILGRLRSIERALYPRKPIDTPMVEGLEEETKEHAAI